MSSTNKAKLQPVRGTHDLLPEQFRRHHFVEETARKVCAKYGCQEIVTPVFEFTEVFSRTLGDTSDVVTKEMYTFTDKGGETITLRPEATAGIARAFISNGLAQHAPMKYFYTGPMFRYERPQKGRLRQFHQVDAEIVGTDKPQADIEIIAMGMDFLCELGLEGKIQLELNTLGDLESRQIYRAKLVEYFSKYKDDLSKDSLMRLDKNPLRILDSKDEDDRKIVVDAPVMADSMNDESKQFFDELLAGLNALGIDYTISPRLVRGLDYYSHTAFEFTTDHLGAQGTVLAGGRYDIVKQMGGGSAPSIGWAAGVERLSMLIDDSQIEETRPVVIIPVGSDVQQKAMVIAWELRKAGIVTEMGYGGNLGKRMKKADKLNASHAVILGSDELERGVVTLRDLTSGQQDEVNYDNLTEKLTGILF
ncbi:MAG: histidine--tRNA ligase [Alphaproteobacteria bacterium]|nr:histidine--tRNA ligase [Alphaproteobacteria bacterium]